MGWFSRKKKGKSTEVTQLQTEPEAVPKADLESPQVLLITTLDDVSGDGLTSVTWFDLEKIANIRDFDDVILDFWDFPEIKGVTFPKYKDEDVQAWRIYDRLFTDQITYEFMLQGGRVILVGNPAFTRPGRGLGGPGSIGNVPFSPSLSYTSIEWENARGRKFTITDAGKSSGLGDYLNRLDEYSVAFHEFSHHFEPNGNDFWDVKPLATTPVGKPIAFGITHRKIPIQPRQKDGHFVFLPQVKQSHEDAMLLLLSGYFGIQATLDTTVPAWVSSLRMTGEDQLDADQSSLEAQRQDIVLREKEILARRAAIRKPSELLYATADLFEIAVRNAFRELGASVKDPVDPNKEDGWVSIVVNGKQLEGVLEMKGMTKPYYDSYGLRQLGNWVQRGKINNIDYKPIFVGVSARNTTPAQRPNPISDDFRNTAREFDVAILTGEVLFEAVMLDRDGKLERDKFWTDLFGCVGVFKI